MPRCPNHEDSQICPDCTFRPASVHPRMTQQPRMRTARNYFVQADAGWLSLCPHDDTQICPDCTFRPKQGYPQSPDHEYGTDPATGRPLYPGPDSKRRCPGCFGAGTGARCCICGGVR